ncbi:MAG: hypothetical protein ACJAVN_000332 [Roseivirga sp.]|jgi:hypothetical protein
MIRKPNFKLNWKYTLGELALIFLGISLAIAFQNWNEQKKVRVLEREILTEIQESLSLDSLELTEIRDAFLLADKAAEKILKSKSSTPEKDSISVWLGQFINFERFNPASSPYEVLKSVGLQTISNRELRSMMAEYYDEAVPNIIEALYDVEEDFEKNAYNLLLEKFKDFKFKSYAIPKDVNVLLNDPSVIMYLKIFRDNRSGAMAHFENALSLSDQVSSMIRKKLN